jgi:hypothetical protein
MLRIHPAARKHGISDADIKHAVKHAMTIEEGEDWTRLYIGPGRNAALLEVVTVARGRRAEMAIHAMRMRPKCERILSGEQS